MPQPLTFPYKINDKLLRILPKSDILSVGMGSCRVKNVPTVIFYALATLAMVAMVWFSATAEIYFGRNPLA